MLTAHRPTIAMALCLSVCMFICQKSVFYQNIWHMVRCYRKLVNVQLGCGMTNYPIGPHLTSCERLCSNEDAVCLCDVSHHHNICIALLQWSRPDSQLWPTNTVLFSSSSATLEMATPGSRHCASCIGALSFSIWMAPMCRHNKCWVLLHSLMFSHC